MVDARLRFAAANLADIENGMSPSMEERRLIPLIVNGHSNENLACYFRLSESTIYRRKARIRNKLGAANRFELVLAVAKEDFLI